MRTPSPRRSLHSTPSPLSSSSPKPSRQPTPRQNGTRYNYLRTSNPFDPSPVDPNTSSYRFVTARDLVRLRDPPTRVRMLARDFIDDSLYNPNYGYFATKVEIFDPDVAKVRQAQGGAKGKGKAREVSVREDVLAAASRAEGFDFGAFRNTAEFEDEVARRYMVFEGRGSGHDGEEVAQGVSVGSGVGRQVWHTPTELFKPWYGRALARFLCASYKLNLFPYHDLVIYEIGAGNGTLMGDILDYLAAHEPEVYSRTRYRIIEISERLQGMQRGRAAAGGSRASGGDAGAAELGREKAKQRGHEAKVEIIGKSIFEWDRVVHEPCFFLAMEVMDNFPHDVVRYTTDTHQPLQCVVSIDATGDYTELYEPVTDPLISRYLSLRSRLPSVRSRSSPSPAINPLLARSPLLRSMYSSMPFAANLTQPEFLPTRQLELLEILRDKFPNHRMLMSDFSTLPDAIEGVNAPVVQTRYAGETVPCTTYLVQPGFFDIFFPTDFDTLRELYGLVMSLGSPTTPAQASPFSPSLGQPAPASLPTSPNCGLSPDYFSPSSPSSRRYGGDSTGLGPSGRSLQVVDHGDFLEEWGETDMTRLGDGSNPLIETYQNAKFIY
ncbi:S-adenosyl-L-methionine-dependent methyltransferase [Rhodotorula toruloides]|uniref:type II protein arginine methyltransferase n=1 Tax=Rhodotorula toruloides TaxID=5286 RepID=A0A511KEZ9_RHOTO|nr:S-adenosyl-L-methionine-dependent methyltransferase [Rhodotorula toruloides]